MINAIPRSDLVRSTIRLLADIDSAEWRRFFSHLAPLDIRYRFGRLVSAEAGLRLVTLRSPYGSVIIGAFGPDGLIGIANLAKDDVGRAEIALLVRSDRKRQGIGQALMGAALSRAARDCLQVYGLVQPSNAAIISLMRRFGFVHGPWQVDQTIMHWHCGGTRKRTGSSRSSKRTPAAPSVGPRAASECRPGRHQATL